jgi:phage/plasmid-like protein (TIGR03299 family)
MAHQIEGNRMMYVGETPWHGIGTRLDAPPTVADGIKAAGLDWTVAMERLQMADGRHVDAYATVREFDRKILGVVGPRYQPLQNIDAFRFFDPFIESKAATLHTAGCLDEGRRVWVLAHVANSKTEIVPGDRVDSFILLSNSHDGRLAVRVGFTPIRVVCANTLAMAHGAAASKLLRVRHTRSVNDTLALIRDVIDLAHKEFAATAAQYRALAARHVNANDLRKYVRQVLQAGDKPEEDSGRMRNLIADIIHRAEYGIGNNIPGVRGTAWSAYNAVTEHLTHVRGSDRDARLNSLWFGSSADVSKRALELALAMAS